MIETVLPEGKYSFNVRHKLVTTTKRYVASYFYYKDELDIKGCAVSGIFAAVATNC